MKSFAIVWLLFCLPTPCYASYFEGCDLEGTVMEVHVVHPTLFQKKYRVKLHVLHGTESDNEFGKSSYIKCSAYDGIDITLDFYAYRKYSFAAGDVIVLQRTIVQSTVGPVERIDFVMKRLSLDG